MKDKNYPHIERWQTETKAGNTLSVFFNSESNLLVVDVVHKNERGGNEIVRKTLDEEALLSHLTRKRKEILT